MFGRYNKIWLPVFEGEGDPPAVETPPVVEAPPPADPGKVTFDAKQQQELNRLLSVEKKKAQVVAQKAIEEASAMRAKVQLTAKENQEYDARIEQLRTELLTKEEQGKLAADKTRKLNKAEKDALTEERDYWRKEFTDSTIQRSLTDAAASNNAFSPRQIVAILGPNTQLAEVLDSEGKPTGRLEPKVRYQANDKEGKSVTLDLTPADAIKRMKDEDEYLNLFRGEGAGGAGLRSQPGGRKPDLTELAKDPLAYRKARKSGQVHFQ